MNPLFHEIFQKTRNLSKELNNTVKEFDLFAAQWSVLYIVQQNGEMTLTQIWKYLNVEAPTISRTVQRLIELGWLTEKFGEDRREKMVSLSDDAKKKFKAIEEAVINFESQFLQHLSEEEQSQLIMLLKKMKKG
ncbi:MarR family winged helix-turn-helix transcriptional regulator [Lederbergia wuyishanensis]|uniref:DNA-binding MarR family transcriptional regulator n=1 Tax=Lederbergia wuyishanensis TaxID=1347903 RepID=A0ABU0D8R6_9BACI|nr:MarR family transcriptional regulator [Lederbergia wuyishanensis]MCJ8007675.1 MarR family transcriptional regulator [Lederbergia wuyishanensis]MDQ0344741.1 DNA-binding MarR family transcriptional regulator [Lederbergia wuyishanensis]